MSALMSTGFLVETGGGPIQLGIEHGNVEETKASTLPRGQLQPGCTC